MEPMELMELRKNMLTDMEHGAHGPEKEYAY